MRIFDYHDYKRYVTDRIGQLPANGRGEFQKIAKSLRMHPTLVSQVFRGDRDLSLDQACELTTYLGLNTHETEFFLLLLEHSRCGTERARKIIHAQLERLRAEAQQVISRVNPAKVLSDQDRAVFYSTWIYTAVRNASAIPGLHSVDRIAERLGVSRDRVQSAVDFLLSTGLCIEREGEIHVGPKSTHLPSTSPLVTRHHMNWRVQALPAMERHDPSAELFFTSPMTLSLKDLPWVREQLLDAIEKIAARVKDSPSEELTCLNIDWFKV